MPTSPAPDPALNEILSWAKALALREGAAELDTHHVLLGALRSEEGIRVLSGLLHVRELPVGELDEGTKRRIQSIPGPVTDKKLNLTPQLKDITDELWKRHGRLQSDALLSAVLNRLRVSEDWVARLVQGCGVVEDPIRIERIAAMRALLDETGSLRRRLAQRVLGQDRAIDMVCDAFSSARLEEAAKSPTSPPRSGPSMILTFLGPSGVGKTCVAELLAEHMKPVEGFEVLRLDMSAYAGHQAHEQLVGFSPTYAGSKRGLLTGFVLDHPRAMILVDEIEKAHTNTQHIFLQVLDTGKVYDNNLQKEVDFTTTSVVFTTNLGREIYDAPELVGILNESSELSGTLFEALRKETTELEEGRKGLSPELLSRMAKGQAVLFRRLGGLALERIARLTIREVSDDFAQAIGLPIDMPDPLVLMLFVLRFGAGGDARRLTNGLRNYLYAAVKSALHDHRAALLEQEGSLLKTARGLRMTLGTTAQIPTSIDTELRRESRVLLIDDDLWDLSDPHGFSWTQVAGRESADEALRKHEVDFVLLDLHIGSGPDERSMEQGLAHLRWLRSRYPLTPVYLFSDSPEQRGLSPATLERVAQEGGAYGVIQKNPAGSPGHEAVDRGGVFPQLHELDATLHRQQIVERYQRKFAVLEFDMRLRVVLDHDGFLPFEITGIREVTSVAAQDRELAAWVALPKERFADIAGAEHAKTRLREVVGWLSDPRQIVDMGLDMPKGVLLTGPPGTGKTSLAKAVAGESRVPFFSLSGPSVFKKWVGESEATIRNVFSAARRYAPTVIFIDELDAIGARRGDVETNAARVSVLNELLAQMDGFAQGNRPVFVMGATNRADVLDPALIRAGRFDLHIDVPLPNAQAREALFRLYLRGVRDTEAVDVTRLVGRTAGLSGADIRQICKEAGFIALRRGSDHVTQVDLDEAVTTVRFGLSSECILLDEAAKRSTAIHEAGHAIVQSIVFPDEPVSQISILPRGKALGFTEHAASERYVDLTYTRARGLIRVLLSGRVAEEMMLGPEGVTSGCSEDLERATDLAFRMVTYSGMDAGFGLASIPGVCRASQTPAGSDVVGDALTVVRRWLTDEREAAAKLLEQRREVLGRLADTVLERETMGGEEVARLLQS